MNKQSIAVKAYWIVTCLAACMVFAAPVCAGEQKFGVLDVDTVFKTSKTVSDNKETLTKVVEEVESKIKLLKATLKVLEEKLEKEKAELKDPQKTDLETQIKLKREELALEEQAGRFKAELTGQTMRKNLITNVDLVAEQIAKREGLTAIFNKRAVLYSEGLVDITEKLIKDLDQATAEQKAAQKAIQDSQAFPPPPAEPDKKVEPDKKDTKKDQGKDKKGKK